MWWCALSCLAVLMAVPWGGSPVLLAGLGLGFVLVLGTLAPAYLIRSGRRGSAGWLAGLALVDFVVLHALAIGVDWEQSERIAAPLLVAGTTAGLVILGALAVGPRLRVRRARLDALASGDP